MAAFILHHYDFSPYSEKIRLAFGYKQLAWHSVETPMMAPKPDLVPLTAGYRRAPVLQIGADIYCDSLLILREIDRCHPEPTLYPDRQRGLVQAFSAWWDRTTFFPAAKLTTSIVGDQIPPDFIAERRVSMNQDFTKEASLADRPLNLTRMHAAMALLTEQLEGRQFILGDALSAADLTAYHMLWFAQKNGGAELEAMLPLDPLRDWMDRVASFGHGSRHVMDAQAALDVAREATPETPRLHTDGDPSGLRAGEHVVVQADDYAREPVHGTLVGADAEELVIRHNNERVGMVQIHFPRLGYDVRPV